MQDVSARVLPSIVLLCGDPVASVRHAAALQAGCVLKHTAVLMPEDSEVCGDAATDVVAEVCSLAGRPDFHQRVAYVHAFESMVQHMPAEVTTSLFLPPFLRLAADPVVDVRLTTAAALLTFAEQVACRELVRDMCSSESEPAEAASCCEGTEAVLSDSRTCNAVHGMTFDRDQGVAQMAAACERWMHNGLNG